MQTTISAGLAFLLWMRETLYTTALGLGPLQAPQWEGSKEHSLPCGWVHVAQLLFISSLSKTETGGAF